MPDIRRSAILSGDQAVAEIAEGPVFWLDETLPDIVVIVTWDTGGFVDWSQASSVRLLISRLGSSVTATPVSTLSGAMNDLDTPAIFSVPAGEGARFPDPAVDGNFYIIIDDEILLVTSRTVDSMTATRAQEGTTIAAHVNTSAVSLTLIGTGINVVETKGEQRFAFASNIFTSPGQHVAQVIGTFGTKTHRTQRFLIEVLDSGLGP